MVGQPENRAFIEPEGLKMAKNDTNCQTMLMLHKAMIDTFRQHNIPPEDAIELLKSVTFDVMARMKKRSSDVKPVFELWVEQYGEFLQVVGEYDEERKV